MLSELLLLLPLAGVVSLVLVAQVVVVAEEAMGRGGIQTPPLIGELN